MFSLACSMRGDFQMIQRAIPRMKSSFSSSLVGDMMMAAVRGMGRGKWAEFRESVSETCFSYS